MDLYEYQGKQLFAAAGLPVLPARLAHDAAEARRLAAGERFPLAVKAQVLSGGRGKAGGIAVVGGADECAAEAERILALTIKGKPVVAVLLEQAVAIAREFYLAITLGRHERCPLLLFSARGGMSVEEVAREAPKALLRAPVDPLIGLREYQVRDVVAAAGLDGASAKQLAGVVRGLWQLYCERDATLVEVNPLALAEGDKIVCLDSKVTIDGNALWRQPDLMTAGPAADERETRAREAGLTYVALDGDIGVLGNGAGLVMSTLDQVAAAGGRAADFCDVGGGARAAAIETALRLVVDDARVKSVLVSIFGGITRGDEVARGLADALQGVAAHPPVVVRLDGNRAAEGRELLAAAGLPGVEAVADADASVRRAVDLAGRAP